MACLCISRAALAAAPTMPAVTKPTAIAAPPLMAAATTVAAVPIGTVNDKPRYFHSAVFSLSTDDLNLLKFDLLDDFSVIFL